MHSHPRAGRLACVTAALGVAATASAGLASAAPEERPARPGTLRALLDAPAPAGPVRGERLLAGLPPRAGARREPRRERAVHPVKGRVGYGEAIARFGVSRPGHVHQGQDVFAAAGTPLRVVRDARVVDAGSGDGRGNWVALHSRRDRRTYVYFHMQRPAEVEPGERVRAGQRIGRLGCTGSCFGDHLHFEVHRGRGTSRGAAIDPLPLLRRWSRG
ncbi:MAG: M23 family metallopeptidase [Thermoleophilaceae bacterium]